MSSLFDSFWRAAAYCLMPRVILLSLVPLLLMALLAGVGAYFFWDAAVAATHQMLANSDWLNRFWGWLQSLGWAHASDAFAPLLLTLAAVPVIVLLALLIVSVLMTPAMVKLVAERRFPELERKHGGSLLASIAWSAFSTLAALIALLVSMPLWLIPPLILVLPPLIWGWLTYRVMSFDALAEHASKEERKALFARNRYSLLGIGIVCGFLGAAPSLVWASAAIFAAAFLVLVPIAIWIYTLVFAFSSLWFTHYCLDALKRLREERGETGPVIDANIIDTPEALAPTATVALPTESAPRASGV